MHMKDLRYLKKGIFVISVTPNLTRSLAPVPLPATTLLCINLNLPMTYFYLVVVITPYKISRLVIKVISIRRLSKINRQTILLNIDFCFIY